MSKQFGMRARAAAAVWISAAVLFGCGGGGGGGSSPPPPAPASLVISSAPISVSATTANPSPTATINANVSESSTTQYYFGVKFTNNGIASISQTVNGTAASFTVQFKSPTSVAPGTYSDTVTVEACDDSACNSPVANSPQNVAVSYAVSDAAKAGTPPLLTALSPTAVQAGAAGFTLVVNGANFSSSSTVQWNGSARATSLISATQLSALILASDVANPGTASVTVANVNTTGTAVSNALGFSISAAARTDSLIVSPNTISASVDTSTGGGPILNNAIQLVVNGSTQSAYYYSASFTGSAVSAIINGGQTDNQPLGTPPPGPSAGRITGAVSPGGGRIITGVFAGLTGAATQMTAFDVGMLGAAQMGAGSYTDTISIAVCFDLQCTQPVPGSPRQVAVSYTVTGNPIPNTLFTLAPGALIVEAATSSATSPTATAVISTDGLPPYGAYVFTTAGTGAVVASTAFQSNLDATGTLTVTAKPPASLGSGIYADSVQIKICFDSACTKPALNTSFTLPITYVVDASPGVDFNQATIPLQISDMAWSSANQRIYATANSDTGGIKGSLIVVNPATGSIQQVLSLGQSAFPASIAVSDDGHFAYIVDNVANWVTRVDLSTMTVVDPVPVASITGAYTLKAVPGAADSFAVESFNNDTTLQIFDGAVERALAFSAPSLDGELFYSWGADASTIYAYDGTMYQLSVSSAGLAVAHQTPGIQLQQNYLYDIQYAGGLIYSSTASVFNPTTNVVQAPFGLQNSNPAGTSVTSSSFAVDASLNRAYFMTNDSPNTTIGQMTLEGFNLTTQSPTWITRFPAANPLGGRMIRWGANGLAFVGGNAASPNITLISGSAISR